MKDYYEILGVPAKATRGEIRTAWRKAAFEWHPDRHHQDPDSAHRKFVDLGEAYAVLSDNKARARYDRERPRDPAPEIELELELEPEPPPPRRRPIVDEPELEESVDPAASDARFFRHEDLIRHVMESLAAASAPVRRRIVAFQALALVGSPVLLVILLQVLPEIPIAHGRTVVAILLSLLTGAVFWMSALAYRSRKAEAFREYAETLVRGGHGCDECFHGYWFRDRFTNTAGIGSGRAGGVGESIPEPIAMEALIAPDDHWALIAVLISGAACGIWAERTRWGAKVSGVVIAIGFTFVLSNLRVIPDDAPIYGTVWKYLLPLAIPLLLLRANLVRILREAGPPLIAFAMGAVGTVLGTIAAFAVIPLGGEGHKLAGIFCATYVGGSMNYYGAAEALDLKDGTLLTSGVAADNLVMTLYFLLLFAIPTFAFLRRRFVEQPRVTEASPGTGEGGAAGYWDTRELKLLDVGLGLAIAAIACAVGYGVAEAVGMKGNGILFVTALVVTAATLFPKQLERINGADVLGTFLMQIFFATIGASANIWLVIEKGAMLFVFAAFILAIHLVFILVTCRFLKLDLREIVIASNANMGGPTTAAAMAVARRWDSLVIPAILCGTLGYATATFVGKGLGEWLGTWAG